MRTAKRGQRSSKGFPVLSFVRAGAVVAGIALAGMATSAPAFATGEGDPPGNNGTVKIIEHGEADEIPDNDPHVGCMIDIEWYGFDEGDDIVSTVGFELQAPSLDGELTVDGPESVPVGEDAAGGGTDLDGRETYTLNSTGVAHPTQGYHVKVTVHTPGSQGNDTKSKVFWFENCDEPTPTTSPSPSETPSETPSESPSPSEEPSESPSEEPSDEPSEGTESSDAPVPGDDSDVPTNIDAGLAGESDSAVPAMWPLLAMLAGAAAAAAGLVVVLRRRAAALIHKD